MTTIMVEFKISIFILTQNKEQISHNFLGYTATQNCCYDRQGCQGETRYVVVIFLINSESRHRENPLYIRYRVTIKRKTTVAYLPKPLIKEM